MAMRKLKGSLQAQKSYGMSFDSQDDTARSHHCVEENGISADLGAHIKHDVTGAHLEMLQPVLAGQLSPRGRTVSCHEMPAIILELGAVDDVFSIVFPTPTAGEAIVKDAHWPGMGSGQSLCIKAGDLGQR
ncbi:hypothetical protein GCM10010836_24680 [Aminobacter aminovorans]